MSVRLTKRLRWYWQMEASNVLIVPGAAGVLVWAAGGAGSIALVLSIAAIATPLVIGTLYWRAVLHRLEGAVAVFAYWIPRLAAAEAFAILLVGAAAFTCAADIVLAGGRWTPELIAAVVLTALAALEYVNYFHVQLQHFDNRADFNRLLSGRVRIPL